MNDLVTMVKYIEFMVSKKSFHEIVKYKHPSKFL